MHAPPPEDPPEELDDVEPPEELELDDVDPPEELDDVDPPEEPELDDELDDDAPPPPCDAIWAWMSL